MGSEGGEEEEKWRMKGGEVFGDREKEVDKEWEEVKEEP